MSSGHRPSASLFDKDPGFCERQSTYAQYPQYEQDVSLPPPKHQTSNAAEAGPPRRPSNPSSPGRFRWGAGLVDILRRRWPRTFFLLACLQAFICIGLETWVAYEPLTGTVTDWCRAVTATSYTFHQFRGSPRDETSDSGSFQPKLETIPTFFTLFIFGFLCHIILTWDALRLRNIIQITGICITNVALLVYAVIQIGQIEDAVNDLVTHGIIQKQDIWDDLKPVLIAIPCVMGALSLCMSANAWKLLQEFAWDIMKHMGADYRMKKRFVHYQIYITFLKFDFLFFLGFTIQFLVVVRGSNDVEYGLTVMMIPITVAVLVTAAWSVRRECRTGMVLVILFFTSGLGYFLFKMHRIYDPMHSTLYMPVRTSLTVFAVLTVILIVLTIANSVVCMLDFGAGLKQHLISTPRGVDDQSSHYSLSNMNKTGPDRRMTID